MEATRGNGYAPVRGTPAMMMMMRSNGSGLVGFSVSPDNVRGVYCVPKKPITNIIDCNLKKDYATGHQMTV